MAFPPFCLSWLREHPRIARVASSEELGTMSKNNLRGITLVRGPLWGIHSLTLIISCFRSKIYLVLAYLLVQFFLNYFACFGLEMMEVTFSSLLLLLLLLLLFVSCPPFSSFFSRCRPWGKGQKTVMRLKLRNKSQKQRFKFFFLLFLILFFIYSKEHCSVCFEEGPFIISEDNQFVLHVI